ncbi:MAG: hypothetical protein L3J97_04080, partial [Thermoplasmata archaeon]|nr:hypothetical protein [Thermoplasmata archaeon]
YFLYVGGGAAWTPFLFGAAGGPTDTPGFPFFSNPGFPIADIVTNVAFGFFGFGAAIWIIYRLRLPLVPTGVVFIAIGLPLFLPPVGSSLHVESVLMNTPLSFLFLGTGALLILLGWRAQRSTPKLPEAQLQPEKPGIGTGESPTQGSTSNSGPR